MGEYMRDIQDYTRNYARSNFENMYQVTYRRKNVLKQMARYPHKNILEIGCGLSSIGEALEDFESFTVIEPSETFLRCAKRSWRENASNTFAKVRFINGFFPEDFLGDFIGKKYDFIICSSLLHEVEDPKILLEGIAQIANEKTVTHINVPNMYSFHRILAYESGIINELQEFSGRNIALQQHRVLSLNALENIIKDFRGGNEKFKIVNKGGYFVKMFSHEQMERMLNLHIINEAIIEGLDKMIKYIPDLGSEIFVDIMLDK